MNHAVPLPDAVEEPPALLNSTTVAELPSSTLMNVPTNTQDSPGQIAKNEKLQPPSNPTLLQTQAPSETVFVKESVVNDKLVSSTLPEQMPTATLMQPFQQAEAPPA